MSRHNSKLQRVRYTILVGFVGCSFFACSPQPQAGPCEQLLVCCDRISADAVTARQCLETYEAHRTRPDAEPLCRMAIDAFLRAGVMCDVMPRQDGVADAGAPLDSGDMSMSRDGGTSPGLENTPVLCSDGTSNDDDFLVDCDDPDCCGVIRCGPGTACGAADAGTRDATIGVCVSGSEDTPSACTDGCSNDGDRFIDCDDYDCCGVVRCGAETACGSSDAGTIETCVSGPENTVSACTDGCSNDGDRFIDCDDYDCCGLAVCSGSDACRPASTRFVSTDVADCAGTGTVSYTFGRTAYEVATIAIATSAGYTIFGYTRDAITSGPFPLRGMAGERQFRVGPWDGGLVLGHFSWDGTMWSTIEGGSATFSDESIVSLATDAETLYQTHACIGFVRGVATAPVTGGVDYMHFEFLAPVIARGFPGV